MVHHRRGYQQADRDTRIDPGIADALAYIHCDLAAYPDAERDDPRALESFKVGCHHRITRRVLVEWLARNRNERRAAV